jgi:type IV pilus assembly protein PilO
MTNAGATADLDNAASGGVVLFGITFTSKILGILMGVGGIGLAGYAASTVVLPIWEQVQSSQANIETKKQEVASLEAQVTSKGNVAEKIEQAKQKNEFVLSLLPNVSNIDTMIRDIQEQVPKTIVIALPPDFSYELAGTMRTFQPIAPVDKGQYVSYAFTIGFDGKFEDVVGAIQRIERLKPLLVVRDLKLTRKTIPTDSFKFSRPIAPGREQDLVNSLPPLLGADFTLVASVPKSKEQLEAEAAAAAAAAAPK